MEPSDILDDAAHHADSMMHLIDVGGTPNHAEYEAHLLKTLTVIGGALLEGLPKQGIESFPRSNQP